MLDGICHIVFIEKNFHLSSNFTVSELRCLRLTLCALWCLQFGLFPRLMWPLSVYEIPLSVAEKMERLVSFYIRKWLGVSRPVVGRQGLQGLFCWPEKYLNHRLYFVHEYLLNNSNSLSASFHSFSLGCADS